MNKSELSCEVPWILYAENDNICLLVVQSLLALMTLLLNSIEFIVIWNAKQCVGTRKSILLNLCASDLLHGLTTQTMYIIFIGFQLHGRLVCFLPKVATYSCVLLTQVSILGLLIASVERYLCIIHPYIHQRYLHSYLWAILGISIWFIAITVTVLFHFGYGGGPLLSAFILIVCVCVGFIYVKIYYAAMKARKEIRKQHATVGNVEQRARPPAANMIAALVAISIVCYGPFTYCMLATTYDNSIYFDALVVNWLWCLLTLNTVLNPICYCIINKTLRRNLLRMLRFNRVRSI